MLCTFNIYQPQLKLNSFSSFISDDDVIKKKRKKKRKRKIEEVDLGSAFTSYHGNIISNSPPRLIVERRGCQPSTISTLVTATATDDKVVSLTREAFPFLLMSPSTHTHTHTHTCRYTCQQKRKYAQK